MRGLTIDLSFLEMAAILISASLWEENYITDRHLKDLT
jgi:hypothetical protein